METSADRAGGTVTYQPIHLQRPQNRFRWLKMGLLNVVFLIAPFCVWYYMHVQDSLETHTISAFRALNEVDTAFVEQVVNLPNIWESSRHVSPYREALLEEGSSEYSDDEGEQAFLDRVIDNGDEKKAKAQAEPGRLPYEQAVGFNRALKNIQFPTTKITTGILDACIEHNKKRMLIDRVLGSYWAQGLCIEPDDDEGFPGPVSTLVQVPLNDLLGSVVEEVSARFDHVMLARDNGRIVSQVNTREIAETKTTGAISTDPFRYDYFNYSNLKPILEDSEDCTEEAAKLTEETTELGEIPAARPLSHAITCHINVGPTRFVLYIQPSELDVRWRNAASVPYEKDKTASGSSKPRRKSNEVDASNIPGEKARWFVIGVVRDSSQLGQAFIAPITITGPVLVLIIIALAALPLLWLSTKSRRAQLTTTHFSFALGGGIVILALSATLALHMLYSRNIDHQIDGSLRSLNQDIRASFKQELGSRIDALKAAWNDFDPGQEGSLKAEWGDGSFPPYEARMALGTRSGFSQEGAGRGIPVADIESYLHYAPKTGRFGNRNYYRMPAEGRAWQLGPDQAGSRFYLERIRSFVDGFKVTALAVPVEGAPFDCTKGSDEQNCLPEVLVDVQPMLSLAMSAVPTHHGFAVVENGSGRVLFHSSDELSLDENLIDETDGDLQLVSILQSRNEGFLDLTYHGRSIRAFVQPMESVPWTLVTFVDDEILDTVMLQTLITTAGLVVSFAVILNFLGWFYARFFERRSAHRALGWLWPTEHRSHFYTSMIWGVIALSSLLIGISMAGVVEHSAIHLVYFITPLLVLVLLRHVFLEESSEEPVNRLDARMLWLSGGIIGILLLFYALAYGIDPYDGAVSIGALLLCAGVVLTLFGFLFLHRSNRKTPARQGQAAESVRPPAQGEKETHEDVVEGHEVFEQEYSNLSQVKSLLPLLALLTFAGPVSGALIYFAAFDAFSESYSRYSDDQVLRALDLREAQKTQAFQRFFNADRPGSEEPVLTLGAMAAGSETLDECRGVYLDPGPFFGTTEFDDKSAGNALKNTCPEGWIVNSAGVEKKPKNEPHPADNWVHWFVQTLPVFSYESGAIKQQKLNQRDAGRLFWCRGENCQGGDQHLTWFTGQLTTRPSFALHWPAADLDYQFMTSSGFGPSYRIAVVSSIVFFLALVAMIQFWIAKTISHHLFGGRIQQVRLARMHLENLRSHRERALVLISPVGVFERVSEQLAPVLPFTPHNWRQFQDRDFAEVANDLGLENDFTIVVDEAEAIFGIEDQRLTLLATLEEAVARGIRVIMLTRVDPFFWLEMLDSRSLFMARTMPIQQTEVLLWCSLMRKFSVGLVADDLFGELSPMEKSREHAQNWAMSTPREKNVLANLAFSDLYNPENLDVIRHLIQRGLVTNSLPHRLREEGFRRYIKGSIELPALSDWRREGDDSVWSAIFPTLLVIIGLLLFFVVSAGQSTVKTAMAMIGTVIAALPVLMSAVAFMRSGRSS